MEKSLGYFLGAMGAVEDCKVIFNCRSVTAAACDCCGQAVGRGEVGVS